MLCPALWVRQNRVRITCFACPKKMTSYWALGFSAPQSPCLQNGEKEPSTSCGYADSAAWPWRAFAALAPPTLGRWRWAGPRDPLRRRRRAKVQAGREWRVGLSWKDRGKASQGLDHETSKASNKGPAETGKALKIRGVEGLVEAR